MAVATWRDVAIALGRSSLDFTAEQTAQVEYWLTGAELLIRSRLGVIANLDADTVRHVESEVVAEKFRRAGRDESSVTVSVDDGSVTRRYDNRVTAADVAPDLWALFGSSATSSAYSVGLVSPVDVVR